MSVKKKPIVTALCLLLIVLPSTKNLFTFCCHSEKVSKHRRQANLHERNSQGRIRAGVADLTETLGLQGVNMPRVSVREESIPALKISCEVLY